MAETPETLACIAKNEQEEVRIQASEYRGHQLLDMRVWLRQSDRPTKKGLTMRVEVIPAFIEGISLAYEQLSKKAPSKGGA